MLANKPKCETKNRRRGANRLSVCLLLLCGIVGVQAAYADPDLPGAAENIETIPAGSLIVPMDTVNQSTGSGFNLFAYGLANKFLQNEIPVKWAIRYDKVKLQGVAESGSNATTLVDTTATFFTDGVQVGDLLTNVTDGYATGEVTNVTETTLTIQNYTDASIDSGEVYVLDGYDFDLAAAGELVTYTVASATLLQVTDVIKAKEGKDPGDNGKFEDKTNDKDVFSGFTIGDIVSVTGFANASNNVTNAEILAMKDFPSGGDFGKDFEVSASFGVVDEDDGDSITVTRAANSISASGNTITILSGDFTAQFSIGDVVSITGFSNSENNIVDGVVASVSALGLTFVGGSFTTETAPGAVSFSKTAVVGEKIFYAGPFIVSNENPADVAAALDIVNSFNANVATNPVKVFQTTANADIDIRYTLLHKPFVVVSDVKSSIHTDVLDKAGIPGNGDNPDNNCPRPSDPGFDANTCNYVVLSPLELDSLECATLHMEPHRNSPGGASEIETIQDAVRDFVEAGGNFLAQCHAVQYFENADVDVPSTGEYLTTKGILDADFKADPYNYPNSPLAFSQMTGPIDGAQGGSIPSWTLNDGIYMNDGHDHLVHDTALVGGDPVLKASSGKLLTGAYSGGNVFYLGGHEYKDGNLASINGVRMALNTLFVPADRPRECGLNFDLPEVTIEKSTNGSDADSAPGPFIEVDDPVNWTYEVTNTGNVDLTNIDVSDSPAAAINCPGGNPIPTLVVGASVTCTASDLAVAGQFANTATATGDSPSGTDDVTDTDPSHYFGSDPDIEITKTASPMTYAGTGALITYTLKVENTGNVVLTNVEVTDPLTGLSAITCTGENNPIADLAVGEVVNCSATYNTVEADVTNTLLDNTATATGDSPLGTDDVTDNDDERVTYVSPGTPGIEILKTASPLTYTGVGDVITYTLKVTNSGSLDLTNVEVTDPLTGLSAITCTGESNPIADLAVGEVVNCSATYSTDANDVTQGQVDNTATATGDSPTGTDDVTDNDDETVNAVLINLAKTVVVNDPVYPTYDPNTGLYTVKYLITAENDGTALGFYDVTDTFGLATGITLVGTPTAVYKPIDNDESQGGDTSQPWPSISIGESIGAGKKESWEITATFTVDKNADLASARDCDVGNPVSGTGFYNSVDTITGETDTDDNDVCVDLPDPDLDLSKTVTDVELTGTNAYRVTYVVRMDNNGDGPGGVYDIDDVTGFGAGITLNGGTADVTYVPISDGATPVTAPAWTKIAENETIAGQKSESWRVVADLTIVDPTDGDFLANRQCVGSGSSLQSGKGFYNQANLSGATENDLTNNQDCRDVPNPRINLTKTVVDDDPAYPTYDPGTGLYTVKYRINATNISEAPGIYDVVDDGFTNLPTGITLVGIPTVEYRLDDDSLDAANDPPGWPTIAEDENIGANSSEAWDITATFTVDKSADLTSARACDEGDPQPDTGFYNSVEATEGETDTEDNDVCVDLPDPDLDLSKTVTDVELTGTNAYRVTYVVRMDNNGDGPGGVYDIDDVTGFGAGITVNGTPVVTYVEISDGADPVTAPGWTNIAQLETIAGQKSESWEVVVNVDIDPTASGFEDSRDCLIVNSVLQSGNGFYNRADLSGSGGTENDLTNNQDCRDVPDPNKPHIPVPIMNQFHLLMLILMVLGFGAFGSRRLFRRAY